MEKKNGLDKAAYIMLGVPVLIAAICIVATVVGTIWCIITALGDSEGGGWLLFIMFLLGIVVVPCFVCWVLQCVMYMTGLRQYKEGNIRAARVRSLICSVVSMIGNIIIFILGLSTMKTEDLGAIDFVLTAIPGAAIICLCVVMIMIRINMRKRI